MTTEPTPLQICIIYYNDQIEEAAPLAHQIGETMQQSGSWKATVRSAVALDKPSSRVHANLLLAVGGDGTMLRVGRLAAHSGCPVLGINLGRLGFLHEIAADNWQTAIQCVLDGQFWRERRMLLNIQHYRADELLWEQDALNDVVIARGAEVRPVQLETRVNGGLLFHYMADGLIVATATGSTAYAMAVGGPILPPELQHMLLVPIAPHLSPEPAIVFSAGTEIDVLVLGGDHPVCSVDGQTGIPAEIGDRFKISASPRHAHFIRFEEQTYFYQQLRSRLVINPAATRPPNR